MKNIYAYNIKLKTQQQDHQMPQTWISTRQSVLAAVFISNIVHSQHKCRQIFQFNGYLIINRIRHCRIYVFIFGMISLFSSNLLQGGIYQALIAWVVVGGLAALHYVNFKDFQEKTRALVRLIATFLLFCQSIGTIIHYLAV